MFKIMLAIACIGCASATSAAAQEYPSKPVTLMMPYTAGGPGDTITRIVGQGMSRVFGRQFLVENTAGAGGTIGTAKVAAAAPDGYSLLVSTSAMRPTPRFIPTCGTTRSRISSPSG